ncbi:hypothetical protein [Mucilaginibacter aquariorum]|uniref:Uncharacterized protein n=1 Tax=Mucilaginibacter aquariorum TaxID=2967225 RepID=A0ABT1SZ55_9SPHI|nr:hypothetical protein [Mucilaginibacter aquariorum]MCQ6957547.1 hypothetical protein [Mucilaginibacter aquariorum]
MPHPIYTCRSIAEQYLEESLPESSNLATPMHDEVVITPLLQDAGFVEISIEKVGLFSVRPTAKEAACDLVEWGGLYFFKAGPVKKGGPLSETYLDRLYGSLRK